MNKTKKTKTKSKGGLKPLILATAIIGFVVVLLCAIAGLLMALKDEMGSDLPIKKSLIYDLHYGVGAVVLIGFICAMVLVGLRKKYNSSNPKLNTKVMVGINSAFWGATALLTLFLAFILVSGEFNIDLDVNEMAATIAIWFVTAFVLIPAPVIDVIAFKQAK